MSDTRSWFSAYFASCCCFPCFKQSNLLDEEVADERSKLLSSGSHSGIFSDEINTASKLLVEKLTSSSESRKSNISESETVDTETTKSINSESNFPTEAVVNVRSGSPATEILVDLENAGDPSKAASAVGQSKQTSSKIKRQKIHGGKMKPNYFVGIQISEPEVHASLQEVQDAVLSKETKLSAALVKLAKLHLTLIVLRIDNDDQLKRAKEALKASHLALVADIMKTPLSLEVAGVSHFNSKVVFAKLCEGEDKERLLEMAEKVTETFEEFGFNVRENRSFKPHLTLFKLSQAPELYRKGIKKIDSNFYEEFAESHFGRSSINGIQLLIMDEEKDEHGYYPCAAECPFIY